MSAGGALLQTLVFPGLLFAAVGGLLTSWVDRKLTARIQMRVGPPLLQPFFDVGKLLIKETLVPQGAPLWLFLGAPLVGLAGVTLASTLIWQALLGSPAGFAGDLIVVLYLLALPPLAIVLGAAASRNPLASLGASRELKLMLAYELPFAAAAIVAAIGADSLQLGVIASGPAVASTPSGVLALAVAAACLPTKLTIVPFDLPEAETELTGGAIIEYSGPPLAAYRLTRAMMLFTMPSFLLALYGGGFAGGIAPGVGRWVALLVLLVLVRNTMPRVRIDQAFAFFWGGVGVIAIAALALATLGW